MSTELAMNAYVLLGNCLRYLLNHAPAAVEEQLGAAAGALSELNQRIEPLPPPGILAGIAALTEPELDLLAGSVRYCLSALSPGGIGNVLGLPEDIARQTLSDLHLEPPIEEPDKTAGPA